MTPAGEFSRSVTIEPWPEEGVIVELTAEPDEREALRKRFDLVDLPSLSASIGIEKRAMEFVVTGKVRAVVAQTCVVTLQPVDASLEVPFERHYRRREAHEKMIAAGKDEVEIDIEILDGDEIDVGEVVAEEFYLALDPYPRKADADQILQEIQVKTGMATSDSQPANPFEKLRQH